MNNNILRQMVSKDEKILWSGRPNKRCFMLEGIFNPMLPIAIIWGAFDLPFIVAMASSGSLTSDAHTLIFVLMFFCVHLMPVWIYLAGILTIALKHKNTQYIITDKGVYVSGGVFEFNYRMKPYAEISQISIHRGMIDQMIGVGDVVMMTSCAPTIGTVHSTGADEVGLVISDIRDFKKVFALLKEVQTDVFTDMLYPNALRPEENPGYNSRYTKFPEQKE